MAQCMWVDDLLSLPWIQARNKNSNSCRFGVALIDINTEKYSLNCVRQCIVIWDDDGDAVSGISNKFWLASQRAQPKKRTGANCVTDDPLPLHHHQHCWPPSTPQAVIHFTSSTDLLQMHPYWRANYTSDWQAEKTHLVTLTVVTLKGETITTERARPTHFK